MIELILPDTVIAVEAFDDAVPVQLFPEEAELIRRAVPARRVEFATARRCAREALARLGYSAAPLLRDERGAPVWPTGVVGSITHCAGYRSAVVAPARRIGALGIDAEPDQPLPAGVLDAVARPEEIDQVAHLRRASPGPNWDRLLFSAKEAIYKAWYPWTRHSLGFDGARIELDPAAGRFVAHLLVPGPWPALRGRFRTEQGLVATAVAIPAADRTTCQH